MAFTLDATASIYSGGHAIYSKSTLTINGAIYRDGLAGSGTTAGLGADAGGRGTLGTSGSGAAGRTTTGNGQTGGSTTGVGGNGASGGTAPTRSGGTAPTCSEPGTNVYTPWRSLQAWLAHGLVWDQTSALKLQGGAGGNSGGNNTGAGTNSGAGGGGGGLILLVGKDVVIGSTGRLYARGGAGGNASGAGDAGGGGGGGGGFICIVCQTLTVNGVAVTDGVVSSTYIDVSGGVGGTGVGAGTSGGTGSTGKYLVIYV